MFIKSIALSRATYTARVIECPNCIAENILAITQQFIWKGKVKRPKRGVNYLEEKYGGLGVLHPGRLFSSLLTKTFIGQLYGEEGVGKELLQYWTHWELKRRSLPTSRWRNTPKSELTPPQYIINQIDSIEVLVDEKVITIGERTCHRAIYQYLIGKKKVKSKLEQRLPELNWDEIWKNIGILPPRLKETMFMLNHRLLQTQTRKNRLQPQTTSICQLCRVHRETEIHIFVNCPTRGRLVKWLRKELTKLGCRKRMHATIRGDLDGASSKRKTMLLVAVAVDLIWRERGEGKNPSIRSVKREWEMQFTGKSP